MPLHPLINFEVKNYYLKWPKFNDVYSRNNLSQNGAYIINLDNYELIGTHWIAFYGNAEKVT